MRNIYFSTMLLAAATAMTAQAETFEFKADLWGQPGLTYEGYREGGEDQIRPIEWVEYDGFRISFNVYPDDWVDPDDPEARRPTDPSYFVSEGYYVAQWRVYGNNSFTISAPEGQKMTKIEFTLMDNYYQYGALYSDKGTMVCNGGKTDFNPMEERVPAEPYVWTADNDGGYESVTFTLSETIFNSTAYAQFRFNCATITYGAAGDTPVPPTSSFSDLIVFAEPMPGETIDVADEYWAQAGLSMPSFFILSTDLTVNEDCPTPVTLSCDGATVAKIPANAPYNSKSYMEVTPGTDEAFMVIMVFSDIYSGGESINTPGYYTLTIPDDYFYDGPNPVGGAELTYTIVDTTETGVGLVGEGNDVTVYGIDGAKLLDAAPASALRSLQKGVYIINGKTTVIRR